MALPLYRLTRMTSHAHLPTVAFKFADGTGKELCEKIREFDPETPILFFSGSHPSTHKEALSCGAQALMMKPDLDTLRREIRRALEVAA